MTINASLTVCSPPGPGMFRFAVINLNGGRIWDQVNKLLSSPHSLSREQCCQASRNCQFTTEMEMEGKALVGGTLFIAGCSGGASFSPSLLMMDMKLQRCETGMRREWEWTEPTLSRGEARSRRGRQKGEHTVLYLDRVLNRAESEATGNDWSSFWYT